MELLDLLVPTLILSAAFTLLFTAGRPGEGKGRNRRAKRPR
jgi:hypothetical protein